MRGAGILLHRRSIAGLVALLFSLGLFGCAGNRTAADAPAPTAPVHAPVASPGIDSAAAINQFEHRQRERAESAARQGRLADAL
jgi:hypothetical protein